VAGVEAIEAADGDGEAEAAGGLAMERKMRGMFTGRFQVDFEAVVGKEDVFGQQALGALMSEVGRACEVSGSGAGGDGLQTLMIVEWVGWVCSAGRQEDTSRPPRRRMDSGISL
jgi:hypothetical protein